jgi:hypothetical protein
MNLPRKKLFAYAGYTVLTAAYLAFMNWVQEGDPECILEMYGSGQYRLCDQEFVSQPMQPPLLHLFFIACALLVGILCVYFGERNE